MWLPQPKIEFETEMYVFFHQEVHANDYNTNLLLQKPDDLGCRGNMFLDRLVNADLYVVPTDKMSWEVAPIWSKALAENIW